MGLLSSFRIGQPQTLLQGSKVVLRHPAPGDYDAWQTLRLQSRSFLEPWEPLWREDDHTDRSYRNRLRRYAEMMANDTAYPFFIFAESGKTLVGAITVSNVRRGIADTATLGYWVGEPFARHGLMTDAIRTLVRHCFHEMGLHRLEAACLPRNVASIRLLERCEFEREGFARSYLRIAGRWEDHLLYGRINSHSV